jgi:hypothetical protein
VTPRDHSRSRAVLMSVWQYADPELPDIPAAEHSLTAMAELLTGPLCEWPADRVHTIANRRRPGDLHDELVELFADTADDATAIFYFVGHGLTDNHGRLCLALGETRLQPSSRRASTSLQFGIVREALLEACRDGTRIVILDCCYSGLAVKAPGTLSPAGLLEMTHGTGAYTMCASGAYEHAWYETDVADRPMTYFTKYLADVIHSGMPDQPAELTLDQVFARTRDNLLRDRKPEPTTTTRHDAGRFPFARNRTPSAPAVDLAAENQRLQAMITALDKEVQSLREQEAGDDRRLELLAGSSAGQHELEDAARQAKETVAAIAATAAERELLAAELLDAGGVPIAVPEIPLILHRILTGAPEEIARLVEDAARRPVPEVAELASALAKAGMGSAASSLARHTVQQHPPQDIAELVRRTPSPKRRFTRFLEEGIGTAALREAATRPIAEVLELVTWLDLPAAGFLLDTLGRSSPVADIGWLAGELRRTGLSVHADSLLSATAVRTGELPDLIADLRGRGDDAGILTVLTTRGNWDRRVRRNAADELRATGLDVWRWRPLLRRHAWYVPDSNSARNWLVIGVAACVLGAFGNLAAVFDKLPSAYRLTGRLTEAAVLLTAGAAGIVSTRIRARRTGDLNTRDATISAALIGQAIAYGIGSAPIGSTYRTVGGLVFLLSLPLFVLLASSNSTRKYIARIRDRQADRGAGSI